MSSDPRRPRRASRFRSRTPRPRTASFGQLFLLRRRQQSFALQLLSRQLATTPDRLGLLAGLALRRLFIGTALPHLAEDAFALHFLFQDAQRLVDVVIAHQNLHETSALPS